MHPPVDRARARRAAEIVLPGFVIGLAGGVLIGLLGLVGDLEVTRAAVAVLVLGLPLAVAGACYDWLLLRGRMGIGTFAPAAAFWFPLFPLARLLNEVLSDVLTGRPVVLPEAVAPFLLFQAILSVGYAIGFVMLHEQVAPRWWLRVRDRNAAAAMLIERYAEHAAVQVDTARQGRRGRPMK